MPKLIKFLWALLCCLVLTGPALSQIGPGGSGNGTMTSATINAGSNVTTSGPCTSTTSINCTVNASSGGAGTVTAFTTHALLISGTPAFSTETLYQAGFYAPGDSGSATYNWNATSTCSTAVTTSGDGVTCILPSGQSAGTPGRYILVNPTGGLDVRAIGMSPLVSGGGLFDNSPMVPTLMKALGSGSFNGTYEVIFGALAGYQSTGYYFSKSLLLSRNATYRCSGGTGSASGVELAFASGEHGVIQESFQYSDDQGSGGGKLDGCRLYSGGYGPANATQSASTITGASLFTDATGLIPSSTWHDGDGIIVASSYGVFFNYLAMPMVASGAYITCTGACTSTLTLASPYKTSPVGTGFATASFAQTGTNNFSAGNTMQVGNNTYTVVASIGSTPGNVLVGANWSATAANLVDCINNNTTNATCVATTAPNISAQIFIYNGGLNNLIFTALASGTGGNAFPSIYTGGTAGAFVIANTTDGTHFAFGSSNSVATLATYQLPVAKKFSVTTTSGSPTLIVTAGPRLLRGGDAIWADFAPFGTLIFNAQPSSLFTETSTNNFVAGDTINAGNNTYTFVTSIGSNPGNVLLGVDFSTSAANLAASINGTAGSGTTYIATTSASDITATVGTGTINFISILQTPTTVNKVSVYTPAGTAAGSFQAGTFTYQTATMSNAFMTADNTFNAPLNPNATVTHVAGSGQFWVIPAALKRDVEAKSSNNYFFRWPIGREMVCASGPPNMNCTGSYDEANVYSENLIGIWLGGNNTSLSGSLNEFTAKNYLLGYMNGGTLGVNDTNYGGEDSEDTPGTPYEIAGNCTSTNASAIFGGYVISNGLGCANPIGLLPVTAGSPWTWFGPQNQVPFNAFGIGKGRMFNNWKVFPDQTSTVCLDLGDTVNTLRFSQNCNNESATAWNLAWNKTLLSWQLLQGTSPAMGFVSSTAALGYTGYAGLTGVPYALFPLGALFYSTDGGSIAATNSARLFSMGPTIPTGTWHLQGDTQLATLPVPGGAGSWRDVPVFTTTLSELVWTGGATGGATADISGTNLNVTSVTNATPVFNGTLDTIAGLDTVEFPAGSNVIFTSGTLPTGLSLNQQYVIVTASATAATIANPKTPTVPLAFTGNGSGTMVATKAICVGGAVAGTGVGGAPKIVSLPSGALHGCAAGTTGVYGISAAATGGASFSPVFTGGTPGTISGLTAANFPLNSYVAFINGGGAVLPTGLSFNTLYIIQLSSSTVAKIALPSDPTTPLAFTGSGSGTITADQKMTSTGQTAVSVAACPATALPAGTPVDDTTLALDILLGTQSTCAAGSPNILTFQAAATGAGNSGDTITFNQWYPADPISLSQTANIWGGAAFVSAGASPTLNTGSCIATSPAGGPTAGSFVAPLCTGGTIILTALPAAPHGYTCGAWDQTTPADTLSQTANTPTSSTLKATTVANDVVAFSCIGW